MIRSLLFAFVLFSPLLSEEAQYKAKNYCYLFGMKGFSDDLLRMHFTLYEGYVKNAGYLFNQIQKVDPKSYEFGALKRRFGWEFDGMRLHELYFENLGGTGQIDLTSSLYKKIEAQFGCFSSWKEDFIGTGLIRGIGWAILYYDPISNLLVNTWINEHNVNHLVKGVPILILDVFEHAYITEYGLDKKAYIEAFFQNIDWKEVQKRYAKGILP